jgi:hypothetical protein
VVHVRRRVADQENDPPDVAGRRPAQFADGDVERFVDALRPIAAAAGLQLQQVGVEVLDVGGEIEGLGDVLLADIAVGDEAHANVGVRIGVGDYGRDRPDLALGPLRSGRPSIAWCPERTRLRRRVLQPLREAGGKRKRSKSGRKDAKAANGFMVLIHCSVPWNRGSLGFTVP